MSTFFGEPPLFLAYSLLRKGLYGIYQVLPSAKESILVTPAPLTNLPSGPGPLGYSNILKKNSHKNQNRNPVAIQGLRKEKNTNDIKLLSLLYLRVTWIEWSDRWPSTAEMKAMRSMRSAA